MLCVALGLPRHKRTHFPSFPARREFYERGRTIAMRVIKKVLITFGMVAGLSFAASAQKGDDPKKNPPPKNPNPPVINPAPPKNPPPDSNKPKKPGGGYALVVYKQREMTELV